MSFETIGENKKRKELPSESKEIVSREASFTVADFSEEEVAEREDALEKIDELEKKSGLNLDKTQTEVQDEINAKKKGKNNDLNSSSLSASDQDFYRRIAEAEVKRRKKKIEKRIASEAYLKRLKREDDGGSMNVYSNAEKMQRDRIENLKTVNTHLVSDKELQEKYKKESGDNKIVRGFYRRYENSSNHDIFIPSNKPADFFEAIPHEFYHAVTKSNLYISEKAREILVNSYRKLGFLGLIKTKKDEYYGDLTERLVRKWAADDEMERLGIKKYAEPFTREHFNKLMECYKNGELSSDAMEFIKTTKPKFEYFEKIFNEIAANEKDAEEKAA